MIELDIAEAASALATAEERRTPIAPLTSRYSKLEVDDAYAIQLHNARRRAARGDTVRGHKIGLTARAMQELFGVDEPDYGHLFDSMFLPDGAEVELDRFISPQVEVEPALLLKEDLHGPGVTHEDVMNAVQHVMPALEIIDSRIADWRIELADTVADNGSSAAVVLGPPVRTDSGGLAEADVELAIDGGVVERGSTRDILGHPAAAVAWLANALARFDVFPRAGQVVLPGTCTRSKPLRAGTVSGTIDGIGSVAVTVI
jgi:2-keto-4-pentenoate hydratase